MWSLDLDAEAEVLYRRVRVYPEDQIGMVALARRLGIGIRRVDGRLLRGAKACLTTVNFEPVIWVRHKVPDAELQRDVGHEISEYRLRELRCDAEGRAREDLADALGAALQAPREVFREAVRHLRPEDLGAQLPELANDWQLTQTGAALRFSEVTGHPAAVSAPENTWVRGDPWAWPSARQLRTLRAEVVPGLVRADITDARRRFVLLAA